MPGGIADDEHEPATRVRRQRGQVGRLLAESHRHGVGQEVGEPVQGLSRGDVRLRHELEDEDRDRDRHVAGDLERSPRSLGADLASGCAGIRR